MSIKVIIADDHAVVRNGIKAIIERTGGEIEIIGEAADGNELLKIAGNKPADVYVVDISMPLMNGIETTDRLIKMDANSKIIILSMHDSRVFAEKALKCGAKGYILKESAAEEIVRGIREVYMNKVFLSPKISKFVLQGFLGKRGCYRRYEKMAGLTRRERQILQLVAEGLSSKEITGKLNISLNTVRVHRKNLMRKLNIHNQAGLIRYALKEGISHL